MVYFEMALLSQQLWLHLNSSGSSALVKLALWLLFAFLHILFLFSPHFFQKKSTLYSLKGVVQPISGLYTWTIALMNLLPRFQKDLEFSLMSIHLEDCMNWLILFSFLQSRIVCIPVFWGFFHITVHGKTATSRSNRTFTQQMTQFYHSSMCFFYRIICKGTICLYLYLHFQA